MNVGVEIEHPFHKPILGGTTWVHRMTLRPRLIKDSGPRFFKSGPSCTCKANNKGLRVW